MTLNFLNFMDPMQQMNCYQSNTKPKFNILNYLKTTISYSGKFGWQDSVN